MRAPLGGLPGAVAPRRPVAGRLAVALRLLIIKEDGSILIHADSGGYKPLNSSGLPLESQ